MRKHLEELTTLNKWTTSDFQAPPVEKDIINWWNLKPPTLASSILPSQFLLAPSSSSLSPPLHFKLNFDGASQGNPGEASFRGVIKDHTGQVIHIYKSHIGHESNNVAEIKVLIAGIQIAHNNHLMPLIAKADSQIINNMANKIMNCSLPTKQALCSRIDYHVQYLAHILNHHEAIVFSHVKHKANTLTDFLSNKGIKDQQQLECWSFAVENLTEWFHQCSKLVQHDLHSPDLGDQVAIAPSD